MGLVVVDHALAEERLAARRLQRDGLSQRLLVPTRERVSEAQRAAIEARAETLGELGLEVVGMSPTELAIRAVPQALPRLYMDGLLAHLADVEPDAASLADALAAAQTPPQPPDTRSIRAMLASLEEAGLDAVVAVWPAKTLVKGP
jgi:DNA mismatch repair ATPase MutL